MAASQLATKGHPAHGGKGWPSKVFELNPAGLNWPRGVTFLDVALVPLVVFWAIGHEEYLVSALFGVLFALAADPGGGYGYRASHIAVFALIGAVAAALLLLIPANEHGLKLLSITHGLEVVAIVLLMHAAGIRFWNYAFYYGATSAAVLILLDLPQPSNYGAEGYRVLWALCGVAIGVLVMLLAGLLAKRKSAPKHPLPAGQAA